MAFYFFIGVLAAFGGVCGLWAALGWLLPGSARLTAVCFCRPGLKELSAIRRWRWLRDLGLLRGQLLAVDCGLSPAEKRQIEAMGIVLWRMEELPERLELERD